MMHTEQWMDSKGLIVGIICVLIILTLTTSYYGFGDIGDYADTAKFFAGDYSAKIRSSHSYLLGFVHAPFVALLGSFIAFKISSIIILLLLIYSVYYISARNKKTLWMMLLSPIVWFMAPWINPIQIASLFLLWAWYFIREYHQTNRMRSLVYSGILIGLGWAFWDTILYFGVILGICFLYDKKIWHGALYSIAIFVGLLPRMVLDQYLFGFAFFTSLKTFLSGFANLSGGIYQRAYGHTPFSLTTVLPFLLALPLTFWSLYTFRNFRNHQRTMIFLSLSLLLLLTNPQIRYALALVPIMLVLLTPLFDKKLLWRIQSIGSILLVLLVIFSYSLQISSTLNNHVYGNDVTNLFTEGIHLSPGHLSSQLEENLNAIAQEFPSQTFVIGNEPDTYQILAHFYWGKNVKEFVSIQDYDLFLRNETILYQKRFQPQPRIPERRQFYIEGGLKKNENDPTDYPAIEYGIGFGEPLKLEGFSVVKKYNLLYLSKKVTVLKTPSV